MRNLVGAHVSASGGVFEAVARSASIGGTAFALFLKNEKRWVAKPYEESTIAQFKSRCADDDYDTRSVVLPHGSYLINLGNPELGNREKSRDGLLDDLQRCEQLGIGLYNLHPGSSLGKGKDAAIRYIAEGLNWALAKTSFVKIVLENMTGNPDRIIGTKLEDLAQIIDLIEDKNRIGVCIDTCHSVAAGYDLTNAAGFEKFWEDFDRIIGMRYLAGMHLNDSKYPLESRRDVHQNLGLGFVGLECFRLIMNKSELASVPKVLETPHNDKEDARVGEIELLKWLIGRESEDPEFLSKRDELRDLGANSRNEILAKSATAGTPKKRQMTFKRASSNSVDPKAKKAKKEED